MGITAAESQIMEALWRCGPLTSDEIIADVAHRQQWGAATVKTLINRLLKRKAIRSEPYEGRVRYLPLIRKADYLQAESQGLLDRLFDGRLAPPGRPFRRTSGAEARGDQAAAKAVGGTGR